ncbi:response regulator [Stakelama marina]|nr:response regulator [Stakelama marina]
MLIALDLEDIVTAAGLSVDGPYARVADATEALKRQVPACAILDVQLLDGEVFPVAEKLAELSVPMIFHSGHAIEKEIRKRFPDADFCSKPSTPSDLTSKLKLAFGECMPDAN